MSGSSGSRNVQLLDICHSTAADSGSGHLASSSRSSASAALSSSGTGSPSSYSWPMSIGPMHDLHFCHHSTSIIALLVLILG